MDPDLLRQRRNLIAISTALLLFDFAEVKISKVGILGTDLLVGDVRVLTWFAWLMWLYFLIRYYQYWRTAEGEAVRKGFSNAEYRRATRELKRRSTRERKRIDFHNVNGRRHWRYYTPKPTIKPGELVMQVSEEIPVSLMTLWRWKIHGAVDLTLHTTSVTDLILPFVLALAAPIVTAWSHSDQIVAWLQAWGSRP